MHLSQTLELNELVKSAFERVVAIDPGSDGEATLFVRDNDRLENRAVAFHPFLLICDPALLDSFEGSFQADRLDGAHLFKCKVSFRNVKEYEEALDYLKKTTGFSKSSPNAPYMVISDLAQQLFVQHEFRLFRGMTFQDLRRLQFDIETITSEGYEFTNPKREADQIIIITLCDNTGWEACISADRFSEKELLEKFVKLIRERDPDVIEGHNIFRFDLPFIQERARRHKVALNLGRDGQLMTCRNSRFTAAERTINYPRFDVRGRHIVDTYHLVQLYDVSHRDLEEYGLKAVARHFGVAAPERVYVEGGEITALWQEDRERLLKYAMDDVRETKAIANILEPSYFCQTQLLPLELQNCVVRGNATRIDGLLTAEYLNEKMSLPVPEQSRQFAGGLTKAFEAGVFENVWHCDIRSLYPSIILAEGWCPQRDVLAIYPKFLRKLRKFRLHAKDAERDADVNEDKDYYNSLQTTFKILINSFYGYLGFAQGRFNDFDMAEKVTARGRQILTSMLEHLSGTGARVIEMDTDGIYFQPPSTITDTVAMEQDIQRILPKGIEVELDSTYQAMFCYKSKNYALLSDSGDVSITGAALKSRGLEPFQREYIESFIALLLKEDCKAIRRLSEEYRKALQNHEWPLAKLAKTENLKGSLDTYKRKLASGKGRRSAAYELAVNSGRDYRQGDQVSYYVTGTGKRVSVVENSQLLIDAPESRNENVDYYVGKLEELEKKFKDFVPEIPGDGPEQLSLF